MTRHRILGAIAFPSFMLAWALGAMLALLQLQPAGASERWLPAWEMAAQSPWRATSTALAPLPRLDDSNAMRETVALLVARSEVMNGAWQPDRRVEPALPVAAESAATVAGEASVIAPQPVPVAMPRVEMRGAAAEPLAVAPPSRLRPDEPVIRKRPATAATPRLAVERAAARRALQAGRFAEAYARLRPSVAQAHGDTEYLGLLALAAMRTGSHGEAMVIYQHLTALEPDSTRWRVGFALAQENLGLDASGVYHEALALSDAGSDVRALLRLKLHGDAPAGVT